MKPRYKNLAILIMMSKRQKMLSKSLKSAIINMSNENSKKIENKTTSTLPKDILLNKTKPK
jgi:predicted permease